MASNIFVTIYIYIFQFGVLPLTIYANYSQFKIMKKNQSNGSFSKLFCIFFIYSCFFNILYFFKHKYDQIFLVRAFFLIVIQTILLVNYYDLKKIESLKNLKKEIKKEIWRIKNKVKYEKFYENEIKEKEKIRKFSETQDSDLEEELENDLKKEKKIIMEKIFQSPKNQTTINNEKIKSLQKKLKKEKYLFFFSTILFFFIYTIIFFTTNNYYFIELTGFLTMLETLAGIPQILKINKKKNLKSISFFLIFQLILDDVLEAVYYIFQTNPIWFFIENSIILISHLFLAGQFFYFEFFTKNDEEEEEENDLEKCLISITDK